MTELISKHGGYRNLKSFQMAEIVFDLTFEFCKFYVSSLKMRDQIEGAARGGKQNIAEGSQTSGTSKQSELRLVQVARASLEELLNDYLDFLRVNNLPIWNKEDIKAVQIRKLSYMTNKNSTTYKTYITNKETSANCLICLIHQTNYLLDQQLKALETDLITKGDYKDRYKQARKKQLTQNNTDFDKLIQKFGIKRDENGLIIKNN